MSEDPLLTNFYQRDPVPAQIWRKTMQATAEYENQLKLGNAPTPQVFSAGYPDIPADLLVPELHRLHDEWILLPSSAITDSPTASSPATNSADTGSELSRSPDIPVVAGDRYTQLQLIRVGGMGEVYRAWDEECQRTVAIKRIRPEYQGHEEARQRFQAEAALTAGLEHPGIIPIYGRGTDAHGRSFYSMRLIEGAGTGTLSSSIQDFHQQIQQTNGIRPGRVDQQLRALIRHLVDVADTVAYAHNRGIVHRDLKPANVLIGPYGETMIADWGLARKIFPHQTPDQSVESASVRSAIQPTQHGEDRSENGSKVTLGLGTPGYAAPELMQSISVAELHLVDIYSLGAMLVCILTGRAPQSDSPSRSSNITITGIGSLTAIAHRATALQPSNRYETAAAFRDDLLNWIAGEPVTARRESWWERAVQWPRRNRLWSAALAGAFTIFIMGGSIFLWVQRQQNKQLGTALDRSTQLLHETQVAKSTAEQARQMAETQRQVALQNQSRAQKREALAFAALSRLEEVLATSLDQSKTNGSSSFEKSLSRQSAHVFQSIIADLEQEANPSVQAVTFISTMAHRLSALASSMHTNELDVTAIDRACQWMERGLQAEEVEAATKQIMQLRIGELRSIHGNLAMRMMKPQAATAPLLDSVQRLEPLLENASLPDAARRQAQLAWRKAKSALAMKALFEGDQGTAKTLLNQALEKLDHAPSRTYEEAITRVQVHGNMAVIHEQSMSVDLALDELARAAVALDEAFKMIGQTPGGFIDPPTADGVRAGVNEVVPTAEYVAVRSQLQHDRVRLLMVKQDAAAAISILKTLLQQEAHSVQQYPTNGQTISFYQRTAATLQTLLSRSGQVEFAFEVSQAWITLADSLWQNHPTSVENSLFAIVAHHTAGHLCQQTGNKDAAAEAYRSALERCDRAASQQIRSASLAYQQVELEMHQFHLQYQPSQSAATEPIFRRAIQAAEQLQQLPPRTGKELGAAIDQLQRGLAVLRAAGEQQQATEWEEELKAKKLWR
ncbi:MAG: protein kinase domain-containing protein [Planctomycetota bacterium]